MKICPQCGHENYDASKYCVSCGHELLQPTAHTVATKRKLTADSYLLLIILAIQTLLYMAVIWAGLDYREMGLLPTLRIGILSNFLASILVVLRIRVGALLPLPFSILILYQAFTIIQIGGELLGIVAMIWAIIPIILGYREFKRLGIPIEDVISEDPDEMEKRDSFRDRVGARLRKSPRMMMLEVLIITGLVMVTPLVGLPLFLVSLWFRRSGFKSVGIFRPESWSRTLIVSIFLGSSYYLFSGFFLSPFLRRLTGDYTPSPFFELIEGNPSMLLFLLVFTWIFAAFGEEMIFRGYLANRFSDIFGEETFYAKSWWIVGTLLFGMAHLPVGLASFFSAVIAGLFFTGLFQRFNGNLWVPILTHGLYDSLVFLIYFLLN
jgi:membrane protease YdiL (CAAX protease family)